MKRYQFDPLLDEVRRQHPNETPDRQAKRAKMRHRHLNRRFDWCKWLPWILVALLALICVKASFGQSTVVRGVPQGTTPAAPVTATSADANHTGLDVNCVAGCSAAPGASSVTVNDPSVTTQKLAVDSGGKIGVNNHPAFTFDGSGNLKTAIQNASVAVTGTFWQATQPVSGSVSVSNFPASQAVTGTFWPATQPVSMASLPSLATGSAIVGKVGVDQTTPGTTNAVEITGSTDASIGLTATSKATVTSSVSVKTSAGNVYGVFIMNGAIATCWLELINSASAGTLGTGVIMNIPMASSGLQYLQFNPPIGGFTSGIAVGSASAVGGASACGTAVTGVTVIYK